MDHQKEDVSVPKTDTPFHVGDVVFHEKIGTGDITKIEDDRITVSFETSGEKRVLYTFLKLESEVHRIDKLREAVKAYGDASIAAHRLLTEFGRALVSELGTYLHRRETVVYAVPPTGEWIPGADYRDQIFSSFGKLITLDPIALGIAIGIKNLDDEGSLWVRIAVRLRKIGNRIQISVGDTHALTISINYTKETKEVCDFIFKIVLGLFKEDVEHYRDGLYGQDSAIGFLTTRPS